MSRINSSGAAAAKSNNPKTNGIDVKIVGKTHDHKFKIGFLGNDYSTSYDD